MPKGDNPNSRKNLKPPFKKGNKASPGRPSGEDRATILKKLLKATMKDGNGKALKNPITGEKLVTWAEGVDIALLRKAHAGNVEAIKEIKDTMHGKMKEIVQTIPPDITKQDVDAMSDEEAAAAYDAAIKP